MAESAVFRAARVANADSTGWLEDHAIVVDDGRIAGVTPGSQLPADVGDGRAVYDLGDVSLLPGLIDAHFHMDFSGKVPARESLERHDNETRIMTAVDNLRLNLMAGLTTLRDLGARNEVTFSVKHALEAGLIPGPRLIVAGQPITITAGHCWFFANEADTLDQVVKAVRTQVRLGSQVIKVMASGGRLTAISNPRRAQYDVATLRAAVVEAERGGIPIVAHTLAADGVRNCVEAGIHHIIHAKWYHRDPSGGLDYDPQVVEKMAAQGQWADPTIGAALLREDARRAAPDEQPPPPLHWAVGEDVPQEEHLEVLRSMHHAGVRFTTGLDGGDLRKSTACAWAYHEQLGFTTWEAIRSATADTAEALGLGDQVGLLKSGLVADMAAFKGDPAVRIRDLEKPSTVVQAGRPVMLDGITLI